MITIKVTFRCC